MGFWDSLLALSQRQANPGLGGMIGNAIGGRYAPGVGALWDLLGGQGRQAAPQGLPLQPLTREAANPLLTQMMARSGQEQNLMMRALAAILGGGGG
jgi:hypothetical protein